MVACTRPQKRLHPLVTLVILFSMLVGCTTPTPVVTPTEGEVSSPVPPTRTQSAQSPSSTLVEQTTSPVPPTCTSTRVSQTVSTGRVDIEGDPWFLFGANYPWHSYGNDFGENAWGHNGVSSARTEVEADFEAMSAMGVRSAGLSLPMAEPPPNLPRMALSVGWMIRSLPIWTLPWILPKNTISA